MKFNLQKYLTRNKDPNTEKYLGITSDDFTTDEDLIKLVEKEGKVNNVRYNMESGIVSKDGGVLEIEIKDEFYRDNA